MKVRLPAGATRAAPRPAKPAAPMRRCPQCGSPHVASDLNFLATPRYTCKECGFRGAFLITESEGAPAGPTKGENEP